MVVATSIKALSTLCKTAKYCNSTQRNPIKALSTLAKWRTLHWAPMVPYPHQGKPPKVCKLQNALNLILFKRPPLHSKKCSQISPNQLKCPLPHVTTLCEDVMWKKAFQAVKFPAALLEKKNRNCGVRCFLRGRIYVTSAVSHACNLFLSLIHI